MDTRRIIDNAIEIPVVTSFSRFGFETRRRLAKWEPLDGYDLRGRVITLTGATSGLGRAAAEQLARCGATLVLVGRNPERNAETAAAITSATGNDGVSHWAADMGDLDQVRSLADHILGAHDRLDVLIHNAGALTASREVASDGTEATVASQVVGPFLLTNLLLDRLEASAPSRVLTMSSGGMYAAPLQVDGLQMNEDSSRGTDQYREGQAGPGHSQRNVGSPSRRTRHPFPLDAPRVGIDAGGGCSATTIRGRDGSRPSNRNARCRHTRLARCRRRRTARHQRRILARSAPSADPPPPRDPPIRYARPTGSVVEPDRHPGFLSGPLDRFGLIDPLAQRIEVVERRKIRVLIDDVLRSMEERTGMGGANHREIVVGITGSDDLEVERPEGFDRAPFVIVDPQHIVDDVIVADLELMAQDRRMSELLHERRRKLLERVTQEHHLIGVTEPVEEVLRSLERAHASEHLTKISHTDSLAFEDLKPRRHELVVVGFVAGRAAKIVDTGSNGEIDPHLGNENSLNVEGHKFLRPHGRRW